MFQLIPWTLLIIIFYIIFTSIISFIREKFPFEMRDARFSWELFVTLVIVYIIVILGFGLIYFILSFQGIVLIEGGEIREVSMLGSLIHSIYFSGVTMLTIGYGDIVPIGIGRIFAVVEALIGYVLPAAFIMKLFQTRERYRNK